MSWIKKSITRTIGLTILIFIFFLFLIYYILLNVQFKDHFEEQSKEQLMKDSQQISTEIEVFLQKYVVIVDQAKNNPDFIKIAKEVQVRSQKRENPLYDKVTSQLKDIYKMDKNIALAYVGIEKASDLITNFYDYDINANYVLNKREWYIKTIEAGKTTITPPYLDAVSGKMAVTVAAPIIADEKVLGVFGLDLMIEDVDAMMHNYKVGNAGYAVLVYNDGRVLYHPDYNVTDSSSNFLLPDLLGHVSKELLSGKSGITSYTYKGIEKFIAYFPVENTNLIVFTIIPKSEVFYQLDKFKFTNLLILMGLIIVTAIFLVFFEKHISIPVIKMSKQVEAYSSKNKVVSISEKFLLRKDEIGILSRGLIDMLRKNSSYVLEIEEKNEQLEIAKETLSKEKSLFKTTIHSLGDGVISTDNFGNIKIMNNVAEHLTGWSIEEAKGKHFNDFFHIINEYTREKCSSPIEKALTLGQIIQLEEHTLLIRKTGEEIPIEDSVAPIKDEDGNITGAVIVFRDFLEKKQKQEQILYLSYHDQLTGLYNRRFFEEELVRMDIERNIPFSIAMVDVNGLKLTNDAFGHKMGDDLLIRVARILEKECRDEDILARVGGDEFIMLLPCTSSEETEKIIKRIYKIVAHENFNNIIISISIGYDTKLSQDKTVDNVLIKAEEHMYRKKITESQSMRNKTIQVIFKTLNEKNEREKIHSERVSKISKEIGEQMNLDPETVKEIEFAGLMHDIGKITISDDILNKPGKLTENEYNEIKRHPESGYQILRSVDAYTSLAEYVLSHHERFDGKGYPRGLKGENIPFIARIISVADSYEAMTAIRPYKNALSKEEAMKELIRNAGKQFDPEIVDVFVQKVLYNQTMC